MKRANKLDVVKDFDGRVIKKLFTVNDEFDCWIYSIHTASENILNFQLSYTRKILPTKVRAIIKNDNIKYFFYGKNDKLLKKSINHIAPYKYPLKMFIDENQCFDEYKKDVNTIIDKIEKFKDSLNLLTAEVVRPILTREESN